MSNTAIRPVADILAYVAILHRDMDKVRAVENILGDTATEKLKELAAAVETAKNELAMAEAAEIRAARERLLSTFSDISVSVSYPAGREGMLLSAGFLITYERLTYSMSERANLPKQYTCNGFAVLPDEAYAYLVEVKPEAIPAEIMALAPGDPREAFNQYFMAKQRGYLSV